MSVLLGEVFYCVKVKVLALKGQLECREAKSFFGDLRQQGHLRIVQEPVLRVEAHMVEPLDERDTHADVELRLELTAQLQK